MANDNLSAVWPEWRIMRELGQGSFGTVYEAVRTDHQVESHAAIKVVHIPQNKSEIASLRSEGLTIDGTRTYLEGVVKDFVGEIQMMESFKGVQNIVSVEDYKVVEHKDEIGWDIFIRMELLMPFNTYIRDRQLPENEVIRLGVEICSALELCQKRNVIHRDIKPENIFVNSFGSFKLGDFGIARSLENATGGLSQKGTYYYMAPEIERGSQYGSSVDLYSLGLVLYRFLNRNRLPFLSSEAQMLNPNERMNAVRRRMSGEPVPAPCEASPAMSEIILRACSYDPRQRFASATAMKTALIHAANGTYKLAGGKSPQFHENDKLNKTVSVRKAARGQDSSAPQKVATFGEKKKSPVPIIAASVLAAALLAGTSFAVFRHFNDKDNEKASEPENEITADDTGLEEQKPETGTVSDIEPMPGSEEVDFSAASPATLTGDVKIATDGSFFLDWGEPKSILMPKDDGTSEILKDVSSAYLTNKSVDSKLWSLLPYDRDLRFTGMFRQENGRVYLDATQMTDANGNEIIVESQKPVQQQPPVQQVPAQSNTVPEEEQYDPLENWEEKAEEAFYSYVYGFTEAVNSGNNSGLAASTVPNSDIYNEQTRIATYFHNEGIVENVLSASVNKSWLVSDTEAAVSSSELIGVNYADGRYEEISQSYTYYMKLQSDGSWRLYKMVEN